MIIIYAESDPHRSESLIHLLRNSDPHRSELVIHFVGIRILLCMSVILYIIVNAYSLFLNYLSILIASYETAN